MKKYIISGSMVMLLLFTFACSSVKIIAEKEDGFDKSDYNTYAFAAVDLKAMDQATAILYQEIRKSIAYEMKNKGYEINAETPDLIVAFNILTEEARKESWKSVNNDPYYPYGMRGMWAYNSLYGPNFNQRYKEVKYEKTGTFVVDLLSTEQEQLVWRGIGIGPVNHPEERFNTAYESVQKMFKEFPEKKM